MGVARSGWSPDPTIHTTAWVGDDDVLLEGSDVEAWARTADPSHLAVRPGGKLTQIRYRALTRRELTALGDLPEQMAETDGAQKFGMLMLYVIEACRYGLVSIEHERLGRSSVVGVRMLDSQTIDSLCEIEAPVPLAGLLARWGEVRYGLEPAPEPARAAEDSDASSPPPKGKEAEYALTQLPVWLGMHVLIATFRNWPRDGR